MLARASLTRLAVSVAIAAAVFSGCTQTLTLNNDNLQVAIAQWLQDNEGQSATVTCPDDRPLQQGDTFQCQAMTTDGLNITFQVTQTDNAGHVHFQIVGS
jgi:uncharacterized protein DUF4333